MSKFRQDVIEAVIFGGAPTADELAEELDCYYEDVVEQLEQLRAEGLVCNLLYEATRDYENAFCACPLVPGYHTHFREIHWRYCGGPISQALSIESQISDSR